MDSATGHGKALVNGVVDAGAPAIPFAFPGIPGVRCLFSTISAGTMTPGGTTAAGRRRFMRLGGFTRWAELRQVHGDRLVPAAETPVDADGGVEADGHYTAEPGLGLIIKTADCQPILFARVGGGAVAALHVGWRGNAANFPGVAVERLCGHFSCPPEDLCAVRGPSLGPAASEFVNFHREWPKEFLPWFETATKTVNLWELTKRQLECAGLRGDRIFGLDLCTRSLPGKFFSYRRKDAGRQVAVVWIDRP
ncbi:MAG: polyphenol oxidase family protein [Planctomycetota bacterium]|jgi:YfiH family protein|nr:polyphenol oxidase family protein [Planctomycetota bacterium]